MKIDWFIPTLRLKEDWKLQQAADDRERQLERAEAQRRRRAEKNLRIVKSHLP
jgi:hypothetical protein